MSKTIAALAAAALLATGAQARIAQIGQPVQILADVTAKSPAYYPAFSADGTQLMFSASDYSDLRCHDFVTGKTASISTDRRQGYAARERFGHDGSVASVEVEGSTLRITAADGTVTTASPVDCYAGYVWASVSPDASHVLFVAAGKGVFVTDMQGQIVANLGKYEAPVWMGNDHVVAMLATDDGHQFHSSQIVLLSLDGTAPQAITTPETMTMYPTASAELGQVVCNTIDGLLMKIDVEL